MTLITYPTRVHFANDVLEEALHSELDRIKAQTALLVCDARVAVGEMMDRVQSGVPSRVRTENIIFADNDDLRETARAATKNRSHADTIIAFGSSRSIELGRKIRFSMDQARGQRPKLFALPTVDGLPDPCVRNLESKQAGLPYVVICDPTVSIGTDAAESARAAVMSLIRCVESYLSVSYNPPADGMALDGLNRCLTSLEKLGARAGIDLHREVMAAGLNAFLAQEKGVGPALTMTAKLSEGAPSGQKAAIARLLMPGILRARYMDDEKVGVLTKVLADAGEPLADATKRVLSDVEMPPTLADIGVSHDALDSAAEAVVGTVGLTFQGARSILEEVYEGA